MLKQAYNNIDGIKKTLWATADTLRANMEAAKYQLLTPMRIWPGRGRLQTVDLKWTLVVANCSVTSRADNWLTR